MPKIVTSEERERQRRATLDAASSIIADVGPDGLSVRALAARVGASTQLIYTLFGNKDGLLEAVSSEGFRRFGEALAAVYESDPWEQLRALGRAYRRYAKQNPSYYRILWAHRDPSSTPPKPRDDDLAWRSLVDCITRLLVLQDRPAREIMPTALSVWSTVHGFVSLELARVGAQDDEIEEAYECTLDFIARGVGARA